MIFNLIISMVYTRPLTIVQEYMRKTYFRKDVCVIFSSEIEKDGLVRYN